MRDAVPNASPTFSLFDVSRQTFEALAAGDLDTLLGIEKLLAGETGPQLDTERVADCSKAKAALPSLQHLLSMTRSNLGLLRRLTDLRVGSTASAAEIDGHPSCDVKLHSDFSQGTLWER